MLVSLLVGAALADPPRVGAAIGPVLGAGTSTNGSYVSFAPAGALTVTYPVGPLESWVGVSGSLLLAGQGDHVVPASLLQAEVGAGLGGRLASGGVYVGIGYPGPILGLYGRTLFPSASTLEWMGLEGRLFETPATDSTGIALLFRVEPGAGGAHRRPVRRRPPPGPPPPPPPPPADDRPPGEAPSTVIPAGEAAPPSGDTGSDGASGASESPAPEHHDEPY